MLYAQNTLVKRSYTLIGKVFDENDRPLEGATIVVDSTNIATVSNQFGFYSVTSLREGVYYITCSYVGYAPQKKMLTLRKQDHIDFKLQPDIELQPTVNVVAQRRATDLETVTTTRVTAQTLEENSGKALGEILKKISGMNSITTGPSISKPVIHGLHSNRVLILNNGVRHEAQQWGLEHAPEIDPYLNSNITIIKGAASIRYGAEAIGGVILMAPPVLPATPAETTGDVHFVGSNNYNLTAFSGNIQSAFDKKLTGLSFRLQGTAKKAGNSKTPGYYLKNTGFNETNFSGAGGYAKKGFKFNLFYSSFNTWLGVFEGSHVGNITDLQEALTRETPLVSSGFSYDIARSKQRVEHSLFKASGVYATPTFGSAELTYSSQKNSRQEYDLDLPFSSDPTWQTRPQLDFSIYTDALSAVYAHPFRKDGFAGQVGAEVAQQTNICEGLRYLIPNFRTYTGGIFALERLVKEKYSLEAGVRYDYRSMRGFPLTAKGTSSYVANRAYNNVTYTLGGSYHFTKSFSTSLNFASAWRSPSVNESYIAGVHLSAASYELGDSTLQSERSNGVTFTAKYTSKKFNVELTTYYNAINNFIYSRPLREPVTLISGAYPSFQYTQTDAALSGFDVDMEAALSEELKLETKLTVVYGVNKKANEWLVLMPADRLTNTLQYSLREEKGSVFSKSYLALSHTVVARQTRIPEVDIDKTAAFGTNFTDVLLNATHTWDTPLQSDYAFPAAGYMLFDIAASTTMTLPGKQPQPMIFTLTVNNALDTRYRDYLSRYRYFADDLGRVVSLHLHLPFR